MSTIAQASTDFLLQAPAAELSKADQTQLENEQRLRLALETGRIGLWVWNSTDAGHAGEWSDRLKEIFGVPPETVVTRELFLRCVHQEDRDRVNESVMNALGGAGGGTYAAEYRIIHQSDGSQRWVSARGQAFFDDHGQALRLIGTVMDVTERHQIEAEHLRSNAELEQRVAERTEELARINDELRREIGERKCAEAALLQSKSDLRLAIDTIPGLVWSSLPDGHIEYLNQRWLDYTGLAQEEAAGWRWQSAVHPGDLAGLIAYWTSLLKAGVAGEYEARLRRHDGQFRWFLFRGVPLHDERGRLVKWYGTNTDIDDRRASEHVARGHLNALTQMLEVLGQESDPDQLPRHVVKTILTQLGAASVTIWERNGDKLDLLGINEEGHFRTRREAGFFEGSIPLAGPAPPLWVEAMQSGTHIVIEDIDKEPSRIMLADGRATVWEARDLTRPFAQLKAHMAAQGVRALLIEPMILAGELAGIIGIRFQGTRVLGAEEFGLTKALAHQAMLAVQLMRLSQQSRRAAVMGERNRLARDIHDTLAQGFTGVIVQLEAAEDAQARGLSSETHAHISRARELARDSLQEARRSLQALRPQALERLPLCEALADLFEKMTAGASMRAKFTLKGKANPLLPEVEETLLRIAQEVLTNALRHANARHFEGVGYFESARVHLEMRDDGSGFDARAQHEGFGLLGIRERVERLGGALVIESELGAGSSVRVSLPLPLLNSTTP